MTHLRRMALESPETLAEAPVELVGELGVLRGGRGREGPDHQHGSLGQEREPVPEQVAQPSLHQVAGDGGADRLGWKVRLLNVFTPLEGAWVAVEHRIVAREAHQLESTGTAHPRTT